MPVAYPKIDIEVYCSCGAWLCGQTEVVQNDWPKLVVSPCKKCAAAASMEYGNMTEHTKGPWRIDCWHGQHDECGALIVGANGERICDTAAEFYLRRSEYIATHAAYRANARLIAAAPDLLHACKVALASMEYGNMPDWAILEKAIAKVEDNNE